MINVTHQGRSSEFNVNGDDVDFSDEEVIRISEEVAVLPRGALTSYVVDRIEHNRIYVRPKVPFGA